LWHGEQRALYRLSGTRTPGRATTRGGATRLHAQCARRDGAAQRDVHALWRSGDSARQHGDVMAVGYGAAMTA